jgi:hypothetical protein
MTWPTRYRPNSTNEPNSNGLNGEQELKPDGANVKNDANNAYTEWPHDTAPN